MRDCLPASPACLAAGLPPAGPHARAASPARLPPPSAQPPNPGSADRAEAYYAALLQGAGGHRDASLRPVFVVGLPRSGSTLIEQILASHSQVAGAGVAVGCAGSVGSGGSGQRGARRPCHPPRNTPRRCGAPVKTPRWRRCCQSCWPRCGRQVAWWRQRPLRRSGQSTELRCGSGCPRSGRARAGSWTKCCATSGAEG